MSFTLILGPMKSGKSLDLIARIAPYKFADKNVVYVQPQKNTRDEGIMSRSGLRVESVKVQSLAAVDSATDVIGVDEAFMFDEADVQTIRKWLTENKQVIISTLDLDYSGTMFPLVQRLLELKPETVIYKQAVCDVCKSYCAGYSQVLHNNKPISSGIPKIIPEDGTYEYQARCRACFKRDV